MGKKIKNDTTEFKKGDRVFAKIKGFPYWPARIENVPSETETSKKYRIIFYGTYETNMIKSDALIMFNKETKAIHGTKKNPKFIDAMWEMENDPFLKSRKEKSLKNSKSQPSDATSHEENTSNMSPTSSSTISSKNEDEYQDNEEDETNQSISSAITNNKISEFDELNKQKVNSINKDAFNSRRSLRHSNRNNIIDSINDNTLITDTLSKNSKTSVSNNSTRKSSRYKSKFEEHEEEYEADSNKNESIESTSSSSTPSVVSPQLKTLNQDGIEVEDGSVDSSSSNKTIQNSTDEFLPELSSRRQSNRQKQPNKRYLDHSIEPKESTCSSKKSKHSRFKENERMEENTKNEIKENRSQTNSPTLSNNSDSNSLIVSNKIIEEKAEFGKNSKKKPDDDYEKESFNENNNTECTKDAVYHGLIVESDNMNLKENSNANIQSPKDISSKNKDNTNNENNKKFKNNVTERIISTLTSVNKNEDSSSSNSISSSISSFTVNQNSELNEKGKIKKNKIFQKKIKYIKNIRIQVALFRMDMEIKKSLRTDKTDINRCCLIMQDLLKLPIEKTHLFKCPDVVETIKKCRKFKHSEKIREASAECYTKFCKILIINPDETFANEFEKEKSKFLSDNLKKIKKERLIARKLMLIDKNKNTMKTHLLNSKNDSVQKN